MTARARVRHEPRARYRRSSVLAQRFDPLVSLVAHGMGVEEWLGAEGNELIMPTDAFGLSIHLVQEVPLMSGQHGSEDLVVLEPLAAVRRLERQMFRGSRYDPVQVVSLIVEEALLCGAHDVDVRVLGRWIVIYSSYDWLREDGRDVAAAFAGIRSYLAGGDNSMRPEVLLTAFAPAVFTVSSNSCSDQGRPSPIAWDSPASADLR